MELKSGGDYAPLSVGGDTVSGIFVQDDDTGDVVYVDRVQAAKLGKILTTFAETGEVPE